MQYICVLFANVSALEVADSIHWIRRFLIPVFETSLGGEWLLWKGWTVSVNVFGPGLYHWNRCRWCCEKLNLEEGSKKHRSSHGDSLFAPYLALHHWFSIPYDSSSSILRLGLASWAFCQCCWHELLLCFDVFCINAILPTLRTHYLPSSAFMLLFPQWKWQTLQEQYTSPRGKLQISAFKVGANGLQSHRAIFRPSGVLTRLAVLGHLPSCDPQWGWQHFTLSEV